MNRIILALDTTNLDEAIKIAKITKDKIFTIKLGLEFFNAHGKLGVKKFNEIGISNLMLDLKLKDIPETVYKAIKALDDIKFGFYVIHNLRKDFQNINDYKKGYYQSLGMVYKIK